MAPALSGNGEFKKYNVQPGVGSPGPVKSLMECLIACESAPGCSIAVFSPDSLQCLLKGCPSKHTVACPVRLVPTWHFRKSFGAQLIATCSVQA